MNPKHPPGPPMTLGNMRAPKAVASATGHIVRLVKFCNREVISQFGGQ
jgi:hypothetical protein